MQDAQSSPDLAKLGESTATRHVASSGISAAANVHTQGVSDVAEKSNDVVPAAREVPLQERVIDWARQPHDATPWRYAGKRLFDLVILALVAIPALMIGVVSAIAILLDDGSPVLFRQVRSGRDGKPFVLLKLRTMAMVKQRNDEFPKPQDITRIGRILRRISIDELPQLVNVLRGDMSIVGPRPTLPYQVQRYDSRQFGRLRAQPGLTGLAQVNGRNEMTWPERIEWDLFYVANQSLRLDLRILAFTARAIITGDGVSGHPHNDPIAQLEQRSAS